VLAVIEAPWAVDASGQSVPTALSVSNNVVTLTVAHHEAAYAYPIIANTDVASCIDVGPCAQAASGGPVVSRMKSYAWSYRHRYNGGFQSYKADDCTNFMSQILNAGGISMQHWPYFADTEDRWAPEAWWNVPGGSGRHSTASWAAASNFVHWALQYKYAENLHDSQSWQPGDFVAWAFLAHHTQGTIAHLDFVYQLDNSGQPEFLQHSVPYWNPTPIAKWKQVATGQDHDGPLWWVHLRFIHTTPTGDPGVITVLPTSGP
jgi:hypothetical protein